MYDDVYEIETARGCPRCDLYWELIPGCPYFCHKWVNKIDEEKEEKEDE